MDQAAVKLGVKDMEDWYKKGKISDVIQVGGSGLLDRYKGSLTKALLDMYL